MSCNKEVNEMLMQVAPGNSLRDGIDDILDGELGALIVIGYDDKIKKMIDGGFRLNCKFTPEKLYELSKMDGAIIVSDDCTEIKYANVHLQVERKYSSEESGTRHRTAQRAGKQTGKLVIAISSRKNVISLYKGEHKYKLKSLPVLMEEANQAIRTLERYKNVLDDELENLTMLELDDLVTFNEVCSVMQRFEMLRRIEKELISSISELGGEGRLISMQHGEIMHGVTEEEHDFLRDYSQQLNNLREDFVDHDAREFIIEEESIFSGISKHLNLLPQDDLLTKEVYLVALGYPRSKGLDTEVRPKGYRVLGKISKITKDRNKLITTYQTLSKIQDASEEDLYPGLSKIKIKALKKGIERLKSTIKLKR
ncbi:DNA integrity scanning diadenylate cyclase DisA [Fusobacterium sp. PH5-44]|uniref:DNA integrity scanning diadenylate cyclase DisA n=1 Tax=unclassified Fusobacterium TaxID=2648384 RepID=UPI003D1BAD7E